MRRIRHRISVLLILVCLVQTGICFAQEAPQAAPTIREIVFSGVQHIPADAQKQMHDVIKSKVGQPYSQETVDTDVDAIRELGWFVRASARTEPIEGGVRLIFTVVEAPIITGIEFIGNTKLTVADLMKQVKTRTGMVLNRQNVKQDALAIETAYAEKGYTEVRVVDINITDENKLQFFIFEPTIGEIRIVGNTKTKEYVIRRELTIRPGDVYNKNTVSTSLNNLNQLGIFEEAEAVPEPGTEPGRLIETIRVKERRTGSAAVGVGHSNIEGLIGFLNVSDSNLLGTGQNLGVQVQFGVDNSYQLTYTHPWIDQNKTSFTTNLYNRTILREAVQSDQTFLYNERRTGANVSLGRPVGKNNTAYLTFRADTVHATKDNNSNPPPILLQESNVRSIALSGVHDTRNNFLNPSAGTYSNLTAEFAGFGGANFTKFTAEGRHYWNLRRSRQPSSEVTPGTKKPALPLVFATRLMAGVTSGAPPFLDQFLIGGADSLRGFKEDRFPGERFVLSNNELRLPLSESLQAVGFFDAGDAWHGAFANQFGDQDFRLHYGYGLGIRVVTPIGPLRLDYGLNGEGGHEIHFGVGATF